MMTYEKFVAEARRIKEQGMEEYFVWCPDHGSTFEDAKRFKAAGPSHAAELWAEREDSDSADYLVVGGQDATVIVCLVVATDDSRELTYIVSGEFVPQYQARLAVTMATEEDRLKHRADPPCEGKDPRGCWNVRCQLGKRCCRGA